MDRKGKGRAVPVAKKEEIVQELDSDELDELDDDEPTPPVVTLAPPPKAPVAVKKAVILQPDFEMDLLNAAARSRAKGKGRAHEIVEETDDDDEDFKMSDQEDEKDEEEEEIDDLIMQSVINVSTRFRDHLRPITDNLTGEPQDYQYHDRRSCGCLIFSSGSKEQHHLDLF